MTKIKLASDAPGVAQYHWVLCGERLSVTGNTEGPIAIVKLASQLQGSWNLREPAWEDSIPVPDTVKTVLNTAPFLAIFPFSNDGVKMEKRAREYAPGAFLSSSTAVFQVEWERKRSILKAALGLWILSTGN